MKNLMSVVLVASMAAPASAQTWAQSIQSVAGARFMASEVPALGKSGAVASPQRGFASSANKGGGLYEQAKGFAAEVIRVDKALDSRYDAYRKSLAPADLAALEPLKKEREYYGAIWRSIVEPARDLPKEDARISPVLQALYYYLGPIPARAEKLEKAKAASAKAVELASAAAGGASARLHLDDRKAVEEFGLIEGDFAQVSAAVADERKASVEYMGWVKEAYEKTAAWAKAIKIDASLGEQQAWVYADYLKNAKLAKDLMDKKLGPLSVK